MLSRVKSLKGLAVLRPFTANMTEQRLQHEFRTEFERLDHLDRQVTAWFIRRSPIMTEKLGPPAHDHWHWPR